MPGLLTKTPPLLRFLIVDVCSACGTSVGQRAIVGGPSSPEENKKRRTAMPRKAARENLTEPKPLDINALLTGIIDGVVMATAKAMTPPGEDESQAQADLYQ
jgi:hypothetical protein